jgi:filamentous hemagglutinin
VVYGNTNLNQNADIILNEVGSTNRSVLKGALEVFGKNAAVVIANPNGFDICGWTFGGIYNLIGGVHITYAT